MKNVYFLFVLFSFLSCKPKENEKIYTNKKNSKEQTVNINGVTDESNFIRYLSIVNDSYFYGINHKFLSKSIERDTININLKKVSTPQIFELSTFGKNIMYSTRIFVTPGDSVQFSLKKGIFKFTGNNSEHYNFYLELDKNNNQWTKVKFNKFSGDFENYKRKCDSLYNVRFSFLSNYVKKHKIISKEFIKTIKEEFRFEHLLNLIRPRLDIEENFSVNTSEDLISFLEMSKRKEGDFFDLNRYLGEVTIEDLNKPHLVNNLFYKMSIVPLVRQYFVNSNEIPYSKEAFTQELTFIKKSFDQEIVLYATGRLIVDYYEKGLGKDKNSNEFMKNTLNDYKKTIRDSTYIEAIADIEKELSSINEVLPRNLKELVLNLKKDTINLHYLLQKKKIKIIDFWASWCLPCIKEITLEKEQRDKIINKFDIEFIYLSIDSDSKKWIDKSFKLYDYFSNENQYKILNPKKSNIIKLLNIRSSYGLSIPRYIILDNNNRIINNNAPKPSSKKFEEIISNLKGNNF